MKTTYMYIALVVLIVGGLILIRVTNQKAPLAEVTTKYDTFAQCISDSGAKFYGAFWCPHCIDQKALFEYSKKLPYIECSTPDKQGQLQVCIDEKITGYPTWKFADGTIGNGNQTLEQLAEKTKCELPKI